MRQNVNFSDKDLQEINDFYKFCIEEQTDFEEYPDIQDKAKQYCKLCELEDKIIMCKEPLLAFSAIILHRKDDLNVRIVRNFDNTKSVRLNYGIIQEFKKIKNKVIRKIKKKDA